MNEDLIPISETAAFDLIQRQAEVLARSSILPQAYRGKPSDIIAAAMAGRSFGWNPMESLTNYHVIQGTASMTPIAMLGLVRRTGHSVQFEETATSVTAHGKRADNNDEMSATFTLEDAARAGLSGKTNWKQFPTDMLRWRAVSKLCRGLFSDVISSSGYVPEELGAEVDSEGIIVQSEIIEVPDEAEPAMANALAKQILMDHLGGDQALAKEIWGSRQEIKPTELAALLETV